MNSHSCLNRGRMVHRLPLCFVICVECGVHGRKLLATWFISHWPQPQPQSTRDLFFSSEIGGGWIGSCVRVALFLFVVYYLFLAVCYIKYNLDVGITIALYSIAICVLGRSVLAVYWTTMYQNAFRLRDINSWLDWHAKYKKNKEIYRIHANTTLTLNLTPQSKMKSILPNARNQWHITPSDSAWAKGRRSWRIVLIYVLEERVGYVS